MNRVVVVTVLTLLYALPVFVITHDLATNRDAQSPGMALFGAVLLVVIAAFFLWLATGGDA